MFDPKPFRTAMGRHVLISANGNTWQGTLSAYRDEWLTLTNAEYVDKHGTMPVDGALMIPEQHIDYLQINKEGGE